MMAICEAETTSEYLKTASSLTLIDMRNHIYLTSLSLFKYKKLL